MKYITSIRKAIVLVISISNSKLVRATDYCGVKCGRDVDKFKEMNLELGEATFETVAAFCAPL